MGFRDKLLRSKPRPDVLTPDRAYLQGRASADLDAYRRVVPPTQDPSVKCGDGAAACPYRFGDGEVKAVRLGWLTGLYAELVDQAELRCREALGLPQVNWEPPIETKKASPSKGGPG